MPRQELVELLRQTIQEQFSGDVTPHLSIARDIPKFSLCFIPGKKEDRCVVDDIQDTGHDFH